MTKVFDDAGSFRIDSRVGLISGISEVFYGDFAAFVAGLKVSFLCFFRSLNLELFGGKSWFSNKAENRILASPSLLSDAAVSFFHSLYVVIIYFRVYKVPCKKVGKERFNEIFLA